MNSELYATTIQIRMLMTITAKREMHALEQRLDLGDLGVSGLQFGILRALRCHEHTISELSHKFMLDPSTLVPSVDALERKGLLKRGRDPHDRRRLPLSLTEAGAEFIQAVPPVNEDDLLVQSLRAMGDESSRHLLALLRELVSHLPQGENILRHVDAHVQAHLAQERTKNKN